MSNKRLGLVALVLASVFWGGGPIASKIGVEQMPPFIFIFIRTLIAAIILLILFFLKREKLRRYDLPKLLLLGVFGSGLNALFFSLGILRISAGEASAIFATVPIVNSLAATIILRERPTAIRVMGTLIGFLGSLVVAVGPMIYSGGLVKGDLLGDLLIMGAVFSWVVYIIGSKELLHKYSPLALSTTSFVAGALMLFPLALFELNSYPDWYTKVTYDGINSILYGSICTFVIAFLLYQWGLKRTSAFAGGIVTYLNPVITTIVAVPILSEKPTPIFLIGTSMILAGVFLATTYEVIKNKKSL